MQNKKTIYFKQSIYHSTILKSYRFRLFHSISFSTQALTHICAGAHPRSCITTFLFNKSMLKVCFAAREWIVFCVHPVAAWPCPAAHVFLVMAFLCQKTVDIYKVNISNMLSDNVPKASTQQFKCGLLRRRRRRPVGPSHNTRQK